MADKPERRDLRFQNLDEVLAEVERLASGEVRTTGNHTFGQILNHLALGHDVAAGRAQAPPPPFFMRLMMPLMKRMGDQFEAAQTWHQTTGKGRILFLAGQGVRCSHIRQQLQRIGGLLQVERAA